MELSAFILLVLSVYQLYFLEISGRYVSLLYFLSLFFVPVLVLTLSKKSIFKKKITLYVGLVLLASVFSGFWSSDYSEYSKINIQIYVFLMLLCLFYNVIEYEKVLYYTSFFIFPFFILVVLFRVNPVIENVFLLSNFSHYFINNNLLEGLFSDQANNILDPKKSGVFFVNANVASTTIAIIGFAYFSAFLTSGKKFFLVYSFFVFLCGFFTGSKFYLVLMLLAIIVFLYIKFGFLFFVFCFLFFVLSVSYLYYSESELIEKMKDAAAIRIHIWGVFQYLFEKNPIAGLGYGGWKREYYLLGYYGVLGNYFPPHNILIYMWSNSGLIFVIIYIMIILYVFKLSFSMIKSNDGTVKGLGKGLLFSYFWFFSHGLITNYGPFGEDHMLGWLSFILAVSIRKNGNKNEECSHI